jgi:hypothetical protein
MNLFNEPTEELAAYYLNRISISANLIAFSLVLALWMSIGMIIPLFYPLSHTILTSIYRCEGHRARELPKMPQMQFERITVIVFLVLNGVLLLYSVLTIVTGPTSGPGVIAYEINILILVVVQLVMMLVFLLYGIYLSVLIKRAGKVGTTKHATPAHTLLKVAALYSFCYFLRAFAFLYRPITKCLLPYWVFYTLAYYLPEFISTFHVIWTYWKVEIRAEREREEYKKRWANGMNNSNSSRNKTPATAAAQMTSTTPVDAAVDPLSPRLWTSGTVWVSASKPQRASLIPGGSRRATQADLNKPLLYDESGESVGSPSSFVAEVSPSLVQSQLSGSAAPLSHFSSSSYSPPSLPSSVSSDSVLVGTPQSNFDSVHVDLESSSTEEQPKE